jgi:serine/threonine protein kinase
MGKVKLARNKETGEQVAVKIVPRQSTDGEHRTQAERERADHSKEVRTAREAAIVTLVDHPYICGMRDVVRTNYHWYMLFEYVNGGQMLDYIISHGRLKEKQARKFGRQIASALDYCHRNSIVHRDLKIENILISKNGDIKIIDFGLSNLFSPRNHLKTFCGSLYFAAPELLQAKQYTGPEVDVWSFGIVLYVLVCGKVPFDDQSMPQLHAKIKKGVVEYPPWLTPECRSLIARMLTTNPQDRATLHEIMSHPWMTKGFSGPPENHLPVRRPLTLPLDERIIDKMTGFDFGDRELIISTLTRVIESEDYQRAIRNLERRHEQRMIHGGDGERKSRGVFDFYKRRNSINSRDTLNSGASSEQVQLGQDPLNAFHPFLSIYYLAAEKQEREAREKNPGAITMPQDPSENLTKVPDLPAAPEAAYTNSNTVEMVGEKPTGGRSRPRARTHGEDEAAEALKDLNANQAPNPTIVEPPEQSAQKERKESVAGGLLRRLSTRRHQNREAGDRGEREGREKGGVSHPPSSLAAYGGSGGVSDTPRKSFSVRRTRDRERDTSASRPQSQQGSRVEWLSPPSAAATSGDGTATAAPAAASTEPKKRSYGLGRSISVNSSDMRRRLTRRGVSEGQGPAVGRSVMTSQSQDNTKQSLDTARAARAAEDVAYPASDAEATRPTTGGPSAFANRARSLGHARKESMQARRARRMEAGRTEDVPEETDADLVDEAVGGDTGPNSGMKPVYLRGIFSVSTTSGKPLPYIRADIIRVLRQLGVDFKEIKGGFTCRHAPSIVSNEAEGGQAVQSPSAGGHQRKISFGRLQRNPDRDDFRRKPVARDPSTHSEAEDDSEMDDLNREPTVLQPRPTMTSPTSAPAPSSGRAAGETSTHVQSDMGSNMVLRFEIVLVKVPIVSLHGIQFKKVEGGTWQYKNMAQTILNELRL